jgi:hypothetical protein
MVRGCETSFEARAADVNDRTGVYSRDTDLTGLWSGEYWYAGTSFPTPFTAHFIDADGELSGTTLEPRTFGRGTSAELSASIRGARGQLSVRFTKIYDPSQGVHSLPIHYSGSVDAPFLTIEGEWTFNSPGEMTGRFVLTRVSRRASAVGEQASTSDVVKR